LGLPIPINWFSNATSQSKDRDVSLNERQKQIAEFLKNTRRSRDPHAMSVAISPRGHRTVHDTP
jgi:hypothetical protein